jgi:hypothetical protein
MMDFLIRFTKLEAFVLQKIGAISKSIIAGNTFLFDIFQQDQ